MCIRDSINVAKEPTAPIDIDATNLSDFVRFTFTDINGNAVTNAKAQDNGAENAFDSAKSGDTAAYVSVISQPSASKLKDSDLKLVARNTASGTHAYDCLLYTSIQCASATIPRTTATYH